MLVCEHMFDKLQFVLFKGRLYMIIIFSSNCQYGDVCELKTRVEIFKKEVVVDNFLSRFKVESIVTSEKYFQHLQDLLSGFVIRNENCGIIKDLAALVKTLKEIKHTTTKKKQFSSVPRSTELYQKRENPSH